jgi:hypothetical protein
MPYRRAYGLPPKVWPNVLVMAQEKRERHIVIHQVGWITTEILERFDAMSLGERIRWSTGTLLVGLGLLGLSAWTVQSITGQHASAVGQTMIMANHQYVNFDPFAAIRRNSLAAASAKMEAPIILTSSEGGTTVSLGRVDPFQPVVIPLDGQAALIPESPPDVLNGVQFVGMLDDRRPAQRIALLRINNGIGPAITAIKKVGETLSLDGHLISVRSVSRQQLALTVDGKSRQLPLNPHVEPTSDQSSAAIAAATGGTGVPAASNDVRDSVVKSTLDKLSPPE